MLLTPFVQTDRIILHRKWASSNRLLRTVELVRLRLIRSTSEHSPDLNEHTRLIVPQAVFHSDTPFVGWEVVVHVIDNKLPLKCRKGLRHVVKTSSNSLLGVVRVRKEVNDIVTPLHQLGLLGCGEGRYRVNG